ncbi:MULTISPECIES: hypothetical protein [Leeuwenhoekiella]|uniref:Lipoprotein n=1 Tax=Leeuwenhoekiella blandensis (strain CECT 7118 / CCUG 51940 / KCTC 22103 / MED217) TaxID=398720 RepID=A3XG74_LEEBM|nr:hypothetical protein [Leeuwenhoekiella blandensis]EAQ50877.1 hypothetical protein MED217_15080 [Leeuwenhoekiella blandensis MED217]
MRPTAVVRHFKNQIVKFIKLILLLTFLSSCSTNKSVVGLYGKCEKSYTACSQIELKDDNTFEYYNSNELGKEKITTGTWTKISMDTLKLVFKGEFKNQENLSKIENDSIIDSDLIISQIPYLSDGKVLIGKRNLSFNIDKGWSRFVLIKTRIKNKRWN